MRQAGAKSDRNAGDAGWIYGTVTPDGKTVTSSGRVATCMGCHLKAEGDRLFGLPDYRPIAALAQLERLGGAFTFNDEMSRYESLALRSDNGARFDDRALVLVEFVTELKRLWLDESGVTDAGMEHLAKLSHLEELGLSQTGVGDGGLKKLAGLKSLQILDVSGTRVTDSGLAHLSGLTDLRLLKLRGTNVSEAGIARLKRELPSLVLER